MLPKKQKRLISLALVIILVVSLGSPVYAVDAVDDVEIGNFSVFSVDALNAYAQENLALYAMVKGLDITDGSFEMSQGIPISSSTTARKHMFFLFSGGACVARMVVAYADGQFTSSFCLSELNEISTAYASGKEIALFTHEKNLFVYLNNRVVSIGAHDNKSVTIQAVEEAKITYEKIKLTPLLPNMLPAQYSVNSSRSGSGRVLDVPIVANYNHGYGLCWAACICSIAAYVTNTTPWDPMALYNWLDAHTFHPLLPDPIGIEFFETAGFEKFGFDPVRYNSGVTFGEVLGCIEDDIPVYVGMDCPHCLIDHVIVICGYQSAPGGYYFYELMDPNVHEDTITVRVSSVGTNFIYDPEYTDECNYTLWKYTYFVG